MRILIFFIALVFIPALSFGQDSKLAQAYERDGEFEKASVLYQKLSAQHTNNDFYFDKYLECLLILEQYDKVESILKDGLKKDPQKVKLYVTYGNLFERQFKEEEAKEQYAKAIKKMPSNISAITKLASAFTNLTKYDLAIETYERGAKLINDPQVFAYNLAELYRRKGDLPKMIENYLNSLDANPNRLNTLKSQFQRNLITEEDFLELQTQLYDRIQENQDAVHYLELLSWVFIQNKDYRSAFRQEKALDRRLNENGGRIYRLAQIAANAGEYEAAIDAYDYIVKEKGVTSTFYVDANKGALRARRDKVVEGFDYQETDLRELEQAYEAFLNEFGRDRRTASIIAELADLEAFFLNDLNKAIILLNEMIALPGINEQVQAKGKLSLGDFYLMQSEQWEATLLYSQVDKAFGEDLLGHEARYRNAKLSYFTGDFQWAQAQFDVLKASTSKLIANDALDLSVFIMDNLGLDTTDVSLRLYADAELLTFQNRFEDAFLKLDTLVEKFPEHTLQDDVLYAKAWIYMGQRAYVKAAEMFQKVVDNYPEEIRADNSLYELGQLYEKQLNDLEKAKGYYEKLFLDYSGSTYAVEARKRFRKLRGDNI